ncbi:hypothetical protein [Actinomadura parmotrematis]|uniref:Uncharacterized protein n=1 Tax=Actinomadura parmotrematis TaxID=2864039 RepID=A0ABS7G3Q1_9ACTN|nr:hypothetical protein [Actinomadura parmotrematis]MBW8487342.1 hypothetical protein [Actinomadura parmotrematis]
MTVPTAPTATPSVHRRALLTWLAVYPTITVAFLLLGPATAHLPLVLRTLVMTAIVVPAAVYVLVPALLRADRRTTAVLRAFAAGRRTSDRAGGPNR